MHVNTVHFSKRFFFQAVAFLGVLVGLTFSAYGLPGPKSPPGDKPTFARIGSLLTGRIDKKPTTTGRPFINPTLSNDPIRFSIRVNKQSIRLGETVELSVRAELLNISPTLLFSLPGSNAYRLKLLLPDGFVQTGGDFQDYVGDLLTYPVNAVKTYRITGYFTRVTLGSTFRLLRSHGQADDQSLYVEKAAVRLEVINKNELTATNLAVDSDRVSQSRSSIPTTVLQIIPETGTAAARLATPDYWGTLEFANCDVIGGWVIDLNAPRKSLFLDIFINGTKVTTILADQSRQDVSDFYKVAGYNRYGFRWNLPAEYKNSKALSIAVKITESGIELAQSPKTIQPCDGSAAPAPEVSTCDFALSTTPLSVSCGSSFTLRANCSGANCDRVTYTWSGNGLSQTGQSVTATAPRSTTTLAYTVVASATGCTSKTTTASVTVAGCTTVIPPVNADYRGYLDTANCALLTGWAIDMNAVKQSQSIDIFINGSKVTTITADRTRPDVAKAFSLTDFDKYGFRWVIPDSYRQNAPLLISVRPAGTTKELTGSPRQTEVCTSTNPTTPKPDSCAFTVSTIPLSVSCGSSFLLRANCLGGNCDRVTYRWTGNGVDQTGATLTAVAPKTTGTQTYTITASAPGCPTQTAMATVSVTGCVPANTNYLGYLDVATCTTIAGWILDLNNQEQVVDLDIFINGSKAATIPANQLRLDVAASYRIQSNMFGFNWNIPDSFKRTKGPLLISVRVAGTSKELSNSPRTTSSCEAIVRKDSCDFTVSTTPVAVSCGSAVTLSANCAGADCGRVTYSWNSNGITATGQSVSVVAPTSNTTIAYTVTASVAGCTAKTASGTVSVTGCTTTAPPVPGVYRGFLDVANCETVSGWIFNENATQQSQLIDIYIDGQRAATITANIARPDVATVYNKTFNAYGYRWTIPSLYKTNKALRISVRPAGTSQELINSPLTTPVCEGVAIIPPTQPSPDSCAFVLTTTVPNTVICNSTFTLQANCIGKNCDRVTYTWSGYDFNKMGQSVTTVAATSNGSLNYTVIAKIAGCTSQTATAVISVTGCTPLIATGDYVGNFEYADCDVIAGWVFDQKAPRQSQQIDIFINGQKAATVPASNSRQDVSNVYKIDGFNNFGFRWNVPSQYKSNSPLTISVKVANSSKDISGGPKIIPLCTGPILPTPQPDSCLMVLTTLPPIGADCGSTVTLTTKCVGTGCDRALYSWSGNGIDQKGQSVTVKTPSVNGNFDYVVTAALKGCINQTATASVSVSGCSIPVVKDGDFDYPLPTTDITWNEYNNNSMRGVPVGPVVSRESSDIRIEIRKNWGAALQIYDKASNNKPLINYTDHGRQSELTIYSGPNDYSKDAGGTWFNIGWNAITVGNDDYPNSIGGKILKAGPVTDKAGREWIYTKVQMVSWPHAPVRYEECYSEKWTRLEGNAVRVKFRLSLSRPDKTFYAAYQQEYPVCMISGNLNTVYFYNGNTPFTGAPVTSTNMQEGRDKNGLIVEYSQTPFTISEPWQAVRYNTGRYIGFWTPTYYRTTNQINLVNFDNADNEASNPCTYITSLPMKHIDSDGIYYGEYGYRVDGSLDAIRNWANSQTRDTKPDFSFSSTKGRNDWFIIKGRDQKEPFISDNWRVTFTGEDGNGKPGKIISPVRSWKASESPVIYIRMKYTSASGNSPGMRLEWLATGQQPDGEDPNYPNMNAVRNPNHVRVYNSQMIPFTPIKDGQFHTYAIPVNTHPKWRNHIQQLEVNYDQLGPNFSAGDQLEISYIGANNPGN